MTKRLLQRALEGDLGLDEFLELSLSIGFPESEILPLSMEYNVVMWQCVMFKTRGRIICFNARLWGLVTHS